MDINSYTDWLASNGIVITDQEILSWTNRSARTLRRWKQKDECPQWVFNVITRCAGIVDAKTARGSEIWRISDSGEIRCPAGDLYQIGELRALPYIKAASNGHRRRWIALESEIKQLRAEFNAALKKAGHSTLPANDSEFLPTTKRQK